MQTQLKFHCKKSVPVNASNCIFVYFMKMETQKRLFLLLNVRITQD